MSAMREIIVLSAYHQDKNGHLTPAFEPREMKREETAIYVAQTLTRDYAGVMLCRREANLAKGKRGSSVVLYRHGHVPD